MLSASRRSLSAVVPKSPLMLASPVTSTSNPEDEAAFRAAVSSAAASAVALSGALAMSKNASAACRSVEMRTGEGLAV